MICQKCNSERIMSVNGKTSDLFSCDGDGHDHNGYVPQGMVIGDGGYGDYIQFSYCLDCGQIQGQFPISKAAVTEAINEA